MSVDYYSLKNSKISDIDIPKQMYLLKQVYLFGKYEI
jgi:hypothetical protein